jgi:hypothetical protein
MDVVCVPCTWAAKVAFPAGAALAGPPEAPEIGELTEVCAPPPFD